MQAIAPRPALQLGLFSLLCALLLAAAHVLTRQTIAANDAAHTAKLLAVVMPAEHSLTKATLTIEGIEKTLWQARSTSGISGIVIAVTAAGGYSGDIELLVGIDSQLVLSGVRVSKHRETPGLGDFIDTRRGDWIEVFSGLSLENPTLEQWAVKKDGGHFDQFTGATITPRAVVKAVRDTLQYTQTHKGQVFSHAAEGASYAKR